MTELSKVLLRKKFNTFKKGELVTALIETLDLLAETKRLADMRQATIDLLMKPAGID